MTELPDGVSFSRMVPIRRSMHLNQRVILLAAKSLPSRPFVVAEIGKTVIELNVFSGRGDLDCSIIVRSRYDGVVVGERVESGSPQLDGGSSLDTLAYMVHEPLSLLSEDAETLERRGGGCPPLRKCAGRGSHVVNLLNQLFYVIRRILQELLQFPGQRWGEVSLLKMLAEVYHYIAHGWNAQFNVCSSPCKDEDLHVMSFLRNWRRTGPKRSLKLVTLCRCCTTSPACYSA